MKLYYTPYDIAVFLIATNFTRSDERAVLKDIWKNNSIPIPDIYQHDEITFRKKVNFEIAKFDGVLGDIDELNILLKDTEHSLSVENTIDERSIIESYFKIIKLELTYIYNKDCRKIKLRRLLKAFGYKRRSPQLVANVQRALNALGLKTYLKGYVPCDIAKINIDDMVIIRLK